MPDINLHGVPSGSGPRQSATFGGTVSDNPDRAAAFEAARKSTQRPEAKQTTSDYDRALRQQAQEVRQTAQNEARKRNQEDRLFRNREQHEQRRQRNQDKQLREETRMREAQLREEARVRKDADRRRERDERAQAMLERRQATEAERRVRQETMLSRAYSNLESRASATQSPATYRAIQRAAGNLQSRVGDFQRRYGGVSPYGVGSIGGLMGSMGSFENTYATQNINRLGNLGGRAADNRDYRELVRIEHELKRIEKTSQKQVAATQGVSKEQKINAQRNLEAVREAKARIAVGRSGSSRMMNTAGNLIGGASLLASNPYVDLALAAGAFTVALPMTTSKVMNMAMGMSKPYTDFRQGSAALGRAGGFNSVDFANGIFQRGPASLTQKQLGLTPQSTLDLLGQYGIPSTSPDQATATANEIRMASFQPNMGLSDTQLARSLGTARTLGVTRGTVKYRPDIGFQTDNGPFVTSPPYTDSDRYFEKLRKVMTTATREGLNHSDVAGNFTNLLRMGARSGAASVNAGAIANFQGTLMSSGLPGMRSGEGIQAALAGMNKAIGNTGVGGAPAHNLMWMTYFNKNGGMPKTADSLAKFLGWSKEDLQDKMANPTTKAMIGNYLHAAQSGNSVFALSYLQPFTENRPDLVNKVFGGSAFGTAGPLIRPMLGGSMTGLGYEAFTSMQNGRGPASAGTRISMPQGPVDSALTNAASAVGLPAWMIRGLAFSESSFDSAATNGSHIGLMQLGKEVRSDYGMSLGDAYDPAKNAMTGARYFKKMYDSFPVSDPLRLQHAIQRYKGGGSVRDIMAGRVDPKVVKESQIAMTDMTSFANIPSSINAATANQGQANVMSGEYVYKTAGQAVGGGAGDTALSAAGGVENAAVVTVKALGNLETALSSFVHNVMSNVSKLVGGSGSTPIHMHLQSAAGSQAPMRP